MTRRVKIEMTPEAEAFEEEGRRRREQHGDDRPKQHTPTPGRLTVVERVYHETGGEHVEDNPWSYEEVLTSEQRAVHQTFTLDENWQDPTRGVNVCAASLVVVTNKEGTRPGLAPSQEDRARTASLVVEGAFDGNWQPVARPARVNTRTQWDTDDPPPPPDLMVIMLVLPGQSARFRPADLGALRLRCRGGACRAMLSVYPA